MQHADTAIRRPDGTIDTERHVRRGRRLQRAALAQVFGVAAAAFRRLAGRFAAGRNEAAPAVPLPRGQVR
jgi:hypothetical protein